MAKDQRVPTNGFSIIGKPTAMVDAAGKTTGAGKYTDDLSLPGMLVGRILHSPYPHARIKRIDTSRAEKLEGVVTVVIGKDAPNPYGILPVGHDEYALALDKVRYVGDNVACVAAVDEATADQALELIDVEYELLPAYFDPEDSMKAETNLIHDNKPHNLEKDYHHVFGDPEKGFAEADQVAEARFIANEVTHAAMEPHSTLAAFEIDPHTGNRGRLTVQSSTQVPYYLQHKLSLVLEMPMAQIRVIKPLVGGGFGGKSEVIPLEIIAAIAARKALAPVKITYTREEVFWAHRGRPAHDHRSENGSHKGRPHYRCQSPRRPGWRSLLLLRRRNHSLFRSAAGRALRHSQHSIRRLPRPDQQAGLRRDARPRHCECTVRVRDPNSTNSPPKSEWIPPTFASAIYSSRPASR